MRQELSSVQGSVWRMGKRDLSEEEIKAQYITPAIERAGWNIKKQVRLEHPFTAGRIILRGSVTSRGQKNGLIICCFINLIFRLPL